MSKRPNILLITSDQHHWQSIGFNNPELKTPNLDKLAQEGTIFTRAYCPNPTCTPTRASIITGRYPSQHGAWTLGTKLPETEVVLGGCLKDAGYRTALVGKAHFQPLQTSSEFPSLESYPVIQDLEFWKEFHGPFYGFERVELARNHGDEAHVGQHYAIWMEEKGLANWREHFQKPTGTGEPQWGEWSLPEEFHYDAWIAERTNELLDEYVKSSENFFLWASFFDPHPPYLVPAPWNKIYDPGEVNVGAAVPGEHDANPPHFRMTQEINPDFSPWQETGFATHGFHSHLTDKEGLAKNVAIYYGMVSLMDKYIGKILDRLEHLDLVDSTLVLFTTDHGHFLGQHGLTAKGAFHYEDLIRVPFAVRWPGRVPAGRRCDSLQSLVDLAPTFLTLAGASVPRVMTGVDQSGVWTGEKEKARDHAIVENRHEPTTIHVKTYVGERYKLTVYLNRDYGELFDLQEDPQELNNLWRSADHRELKLELAMKLLFAEMAKEPLWMPRLAGA